MNIIPCNKITAENKKTERGPVCSCTTHYLLSLLCVKHYVRCWGPKNEPNKAFYSGAANPGYEIESYIWCGKCNSRIT